MPKEEPDNDLCRCCHAEGAYKNLYASYFWRDVEEVVYCKLLRECFDIEMAPVTQQLQHVLCTICDACIERLQDAVSFKRQVLKCEKRFRDVYGSCVGEETEVKVKKEIDTDTKEVGNESNPITEVTTHTKTSVVALSCRRMDDDDDDGFSAADDDDDFKPPGTDTIEVKVEKNYSDSEDDIVLQEVAKGNKRKAKTKTKTSPAKKKTKVVKKPKTTKKGAAKDAGSDCEELDVVQDLKKEDLKKTKNKPVRDTTRRRTKNDESSDDEHLMTIEETIQRPKSGREKRKEMDDSTSDDEELVAVEEKDSKHGGKGEKGKKKKAAGRAKKKSRVRNHARQIEDEEELGVIDGVSVIKVKVAAKMQKNIDYKENADAKLQCLKCPFTAKSPHFMLKHVRGVHFNTSRYRCPDCYQHFPTISHLVKHKLEEHKIDQRLKCNACDKLFHDTTSLKYHTNVFHMLGEKFKCKECDFETFSYPSFFHHKFRHTTEKNFACQYCQKAFKRRKTMKNHEKIHTGDKRHACAECGEAYVEKSSLKYHMRKRHPEIPFASSSVTAFYLPPAGMSASP